MWGTNPELMLLEGERGDATVRSLEFRSRRIDLDLARRLANLTTLTSLNLTGSKSITDGHVDILASSTSLRRLNFAFNSPGVSPASLETLAHKFRSLTQLNLTDTGLTSESAKVLASSGTIRQLVLRENKIDSEGTVALASCPRLILLDLAANPVGFEGAEALAQHPRLTELDLSDTKIGTLGGLALATNTTLVRLNLWAILASDRMGPEVGDAFEKVLESNTRLRKLTLGLKVPQEARNRIDKQLRRNNAIANEKDPWKKVNMMTKCMGSVQLPSLLDLAMYSIFVRIAPEMPLEEKVKKVERMLLPEDLTERLLALVNPPDDEDK
jgi:Ran GTPase-activating protein (RanGAP) involved in mRNA processing and transport